MRKRLLLVLGCVVALLLAGYFVLWLTAPLKHQITGESFDKIEAGMSGEEACTLFGVPPGDYTTGLVLGLVVSTQGSCQGQKKVWLGDHGGIALWFDEHGKVTGKRLTAPLPMNETFPEKIRRLIGL